MPEKIVLKHDDQDIEFPLEAISAALPDGFSILSASDLEDSYVSKDLVKSEFVPKTEFKRRLKSAVENAHENEEVVARVLDTHKSDVPDKDALRQQWDKAYLEPLQREIEEYKNIAKGTRVREVASKYFKEELVTPLTDGQPSYIEVALGKQFANDGLEVYAVDPGGEPLLPLDARSGRTRRSVEEQISVLAEDPAFKKWLKEPPKNAGGSGSPGDKTDSRHKTLEQMSDSELAAGIRDGTIKSADLLNL